MTLEEAYRLAEASAERWWNFIPENSFYPKKWMFYRDMMQDLRAMQKTDEHIWHEFLTLAYLTGFLTALAGKIEDAKEPEHERGKVTENRQVVGENGGVPTQDTNQKLPVGAVE